MKSEPTQFIRVSQRRSSEGGLPDDAIARAARRLTWAAVCIGFIWTLYLTFYLTVFARFANDLSQVMGVLSICASVVLVVLLRSRWFTPKRAVIWGLLYEGLLCFALALSDFTTAPVDEVARQASGVCVLILFFPLLVPSSPRTTLIGSFGSVGATGLAWLISFTARDDGGIVDPFIAMSWLLPPLICAALTYIPAKVVYRLGSEVKRAQLAGSYELVSRIGEGGMGEVWRAEHRLLARPAAVKLIRSSASADRKARARFEREAQAIAKLQSPNTVAVYDFGYTADGSFYYAMELLRGLDLEQTVRQFDPLVPARVAYILAQACEALSEAHALGLVHRDIKPANLFLATHGRRRDVLKVLDFGLATLAQSPDERHTADGVILGTPAYLSPEMATGGGIDGRTDLYSVGCVGYFLLTGRPVFEHVNPIQLAVAHATEEPARPSTKIETPIPPALEQLIMRCLAKTPSDRPASAAELAEDLRASCPETQWTRDAAERWWNLHLPAIDLNNVEARFTESDSIRPDRSPRRSAKD